MSLRRIDSFDTDTPEKLADQLSRLEDNIDREFSRFPPKLIWSDWVAVGPVQAAYGRIVRIDTSVAVAAIGATLPSISNDTISTVVGILRKGAQAVTLVAVESTATIDGNLSENLTVDGLYLYMHDGAAWYRV